MARRTVRVTDLLGREHDQHNSWLEREPDKQPGPLDQVIAAEGRKGADMVRVVLTGCRPWPVEGQDRGELAPEPGHNPRVPVGWHPPMALTEARPERCPVCADNRRPGWFCAVCDRPRGSGVASEVARVRRARSMAARAAEAAAKVKRRPA